MPSSKGYKLIDKFCEVCESPLILNTTRDIERKKYCSNSCKGKAMRASQIFNISTCDHCGIVYLPNVASQKYCSDRCNQKANTKDTKTQYEYISGNWGKYLGRLCNQKGREALSKGLLLDILERQDYRCNITGIKLTCKLEAGTVYLTNASIDRIEAGVPYIEENIQLVCRQVNTMKWTMPEEELVWWCKKILENSNASLK